MSQDKISKIIGIVLSLVIALLAVFGYDVGVIQPREAAPQQGLSRAVGDTNFYNVVADNNITAGATVSGATLSGTTGSFTSLSGSTLTLNSLAVSGPYKYGVTTGTIVTGTTIAHGIGTTPTMAIVTAGSAISTPLQILSLGAVSITLGINDGVSLSKVYWFAGK